MSEKDKDKQEKKPKAEGQHKGGGGPPKGGKGGGQQKQPKKPKGGAAAEQAEVDDGAPKQPAPPARLIAAYREQVVPAMVAVREVSDRLEETVADEFWTLPKYSEMLFLA